MLLFIGLSGLAAAVRPRRLGGGRGLKDSVEEDGGQVLGQLFRLTLLFLDDFPGIAVQKECIGPGAFAGVDIPGEVVPPGQVQVALDVFGKLLEQLFPVGGDIFGMDQRFPLFFHFWSVFFHL